MSETLSRVPIIDGWFTDDIDAPTLIGAKCSQCGTFVFPPRSSDCPNPNCDSITLDPTPLSRFGRIWSYTENCYAPPLPYVAAEPYEPYALAAVELAAEGLVTFAARSNMTATELIAAAKKLGVVATQQEELTAVIQKNSKASAIILNRRLMNWRKHCRFMIKVFLMRYCPTRLV